MSVLAAVAQFATGTDKEANLKTATAAVESAAAAGARLVVLPENAMYADPTHAHGDDHPEPVDGPFTSALATSARSAGITVIAGMTERLTEGKPSNTLIAIGADGERLGVYRKVHLYDAFGYRESDEIIPAEVVDPVIIELGDLRVGMMTCYDLRFPEMARHLVDAGATAIALPAAWLAGPAKEDHWATLARARAIENTCYLLASGQTGPHCVGHSMILDPMGTVLAGAGEAPGHAIGELSADRIERVRRTNPTLANRRFRVSPATLAC